MCKCRPQVKTPFCGRLGCEWPEPDTTPKRVKWFRDYTWPLDPFDHYLTKRDGNRATIQMLDDLAAHIERLEQGRRRDHEDWEVIEGSQPT
jgi:hypothetical protein